jgi:arginine decarboxylase
MNQDQAPVLEAIRRFHEVGAYSFALPGHRFGPGVDDATAEVLPRAVFASDVEIAKQAVPEAERLYADAIGARQAVFTTCGSSISIHTAILTITGPGRTVLVDRNVHKSVLASLILAGADPVWLRPRWDHDRQLAHPATADDVSAALAAHPEVSAVVVITPTEYGCGADVRGIAEACHARGVPLLVDEAWGAHFAFHPTLPTPAVRAGADLSVNSLHKAAGGLCEASMMIVGGDLVDPVDLRLRLDLITTTSPSALLYGSIDGWRRHMVRDGQALLGAAIDRSNRLRKRLSRVPSLEVMDESIIEADGVAEWDPLKFTVDVSGLGINGYQAKEWFDSERHLTIQLGDSRRTVCSLTYADDDAAIERLAAGYEALAADPPTDDRPEPAVPALEEFNLEQAISPRDAYFAATEQVSDPVGRICAEMISPYPPGVPAILPGERFNRAVVEYLRAGKAAGMTIPDAADPELKTFRVVRDRS